ncbi:ATP-dependent DNA ligase [Methanocella sp. MCL-LM]|uniref:ATP-dependent DNA ligase n=1 Tax=Methanocella sp. MCL-LM TaxID=3412035 RepID=UPI003C75E320
MLFKDLVGVYENLRSTSSRLEKTAMIAAFLQQAPVDELPVIVTFLTGRIFPEWDQRKIGIASQSMIKIISTITHNPEDAVVESYKKSGHLGVTAEEMFQKRRQVTFFEPEDITVKEVAETFYEIARSSGAGSSTKKQKILIGLLHRATSPKEAHYIVSLTIEYVLSGAKEGVMEDAIGQAFGATLDQVRRAHMLTSDLGETARIAKTEGAAGLEAITIRPMRPVRPMLAQNVSSIKEAIETMGGPTEFEMKYDGARLQIHKSGKDVKLYSRRLEDLTDALPEIVGFVRDSIKSETAILDSECIAIDKGTGRPIPFQNILTRLRRIHKVEETQKQFPLILRPFDVLYNQGISTIDLPLRERRKILEEIVVATDSLCQPARALVTDQEEAAQQLFEESVKSGNEGLMGKDLNATYTPGVRGKKMVKIKSVLDTLDLAIVSAEWGHGRKAGWLTSFEVACLDEETGDYVILGRVASGFSDEQLLEMTEKLKPLITGEHGRIVDVRPEIIVEVKFEEIQKSPIYSSGYALRFPRLVRVRDDLSPEEVNSFSRVMNIYNVQQRYSISENGLRK